MHTATLIVYAFLLLADICEALQNDEQTKDNKPNIIIILADDMVILTNFALEMYKPYLNVEEIRDPLQTFRTYSGHIETSILLRIGSDFLFLVHVHFYFKFISPKQKNKTL